MISRPHMQKVRGTNTSPEIRLRTILRAVGHRGYRLHAKELPGKPDIVFRKQKKAIFVHGCFWHGHSCRAGRNVPTSNLTYWGPKLTRNHERDIRVRRQLRALGWSALIVWECQLSKEEQLSDRLRSFLCG